mmetsp:Transcript_14838/g.35949  ORF Transcript_14838/g.35949 Transcript_14838/m.35949 type:complete len:80 (+) Transcript_14838:458-697(+)
MATFSIGSTAQILPLHTLQADVLSADFLQVTIEIVDSAKQSAEKGQYGLMIHSTMKTMAAQLVCQPELCGTGRTADCCC